MRTGCPITTFGHDREMPASPVLPTAPPVIPAGFLAGIQKEKPFIYFPQLFLAIMPRMTSFMRELLRRLKR